MLPLAAIAALIPSLMQGGTAIYQGQQAKKLRDRYPRPNYQIPAEVGNVANMAQLAYNDPNLYGRNIAAQQIDSQGAFGAGRAMDAGKGTNEVLAAIAALNQNGNNSLQQLAVAGDQARNQRFGQMSGALNNLATYRDKAYTENQKEPYTNAQDAAALLAGASMQNAWGAVQGLGDYGSKLLPMGNPKNKVGTSARGTVPSIGGGMSQAEIEKTVAQILARGNTLGSGANY